MSSLLHGGTKLLDPKPMLERLGLSSGQHVGDLGAGGMGYFAFPAAAMVGEKGKVYAVDVQKSVLTALQNMVRLQGVSNVECMWSNLEKEGATPIPDSTLDAAFLINVLFQNKAWVGILKEATRLLKPHGKLLVIEWKSTGAPFAPPPSLRIAEGAVEDMAQSLHLTPLDHFSAGRYHYGIIFEKQ